MLISYLSMVKLNSDGPVSVTIYLPHVRGNQPQTRDISLPKLYNGKAVVWHFASRVFHSSGSQSAGLPLCSVRFMQVEYLVPAEITKVARVSEQIESAMGKGGLPL